MDRRVDCDPLRGCRTWPAIVALRADGEACFKTMRVGMIRKAEEGDAAGLVAVSIEVWLNTYVREGVSPVFADYVLSEFTAQKFRSAIGDPDWAIFVSQNRVGIDGFVTVCSTSTPKLAGCSPLEITTLYVQPRHQSSGRGAALLRRALDHCRTGTGAGSAWLTVEAANSRAIDFYLRHGFRKIGTTPFVIADQAYENFVMEIDLRRPVD
ncbi:N-acetyltransferase [Bradyrhizobium sp.]|uniref:GNAT family N-acetyltransferase n=1 Tax=Bradyrhizobium sp. TaxID=376 RepID=UPI0025BAE215|nr:N-acetyltransferase [Bradyrhizobium sp.]